MIENRITGTADVVLVLRLRIHFRVIKQLLHHIMGIAHRDEIILTPENLGFLGFHQLSTLVHQREMQHEEIIIVVFIDFGTLHKTGAVLNIQRVEMEVITQEI